MCYVSMTLGSVSVDKVHDKLVKRFVRSLIESDTELSTHVSLKILKYRHVRCVIKIHGIIKVVKRVRLN